MSLTPDEVAAISDGDLASVLETPQGRRVIASLIEGTGTFQHSFSGSDTHATAYNEGRRSVGIRLWDWCQDRCPLQSLAMLRESLDRRDAARVEQRKREEENDDG